jgi:hypothetical protein
LFSKKGKSPRGGRVYDTKHTHGGSLVVLTGFKTKPSQDTAVRHDSSRSGGGVWKPRFAARVRGAATREQNWLFFGSGLLIDKKSLGRWLAVGRRH